MDVSYPWRREARTVRPDWPAILRGSTYIGTLPQILTALQQNLPRQAPDDCQVPETIWFREEWDVLPQYLGIP